MKPTLIVAVSGGVDSMVLLHKLVAADAARLVVAHVDHGIRERSHEDAAFVRTCAKMYNIPFEMIRLELGAGASEERARDGRWEFLRRVKAAYGADAIVTAHHADDVVETMIINLMRGTGWRGLASLHETDEIKRPLLQMRKRTIVEYAHEHGLEWREDETNADTRYLRNHIRHHIMPSVTDEQREKFFDIYTRQVALRSDIERGVAALFPAPRRYEFVMWPDTVAYEMLRWMVGSLPREEYSRALLFIRVARPHKQLQLSNGIEIMMRVNHFIVSRGED